MPLNLAASCEWVQLTVKLAGYQETWSSLHGGIFGVYTANTELLEEVSFADWEILNEIITETYFGGVSAR